MSSRYQTSTVTSNYNTNSDNRLDELLEDLQSTVASRPLVNGTSTYRDGTTGYREVFKSHHSQSTGKPAESSREYQFEYLNPSNTTSVITERPKSPFFDKENIESIPGKNVSSYKTVSYQYNTKKTGSQVVPTTEKSEAKFRQNINELDTLLDDLNHTQKLDFSGSNQSTRLKGYDSGFLEPLDSSTPQKKSHVSRIEERTFEEQRFGTNVNSPPIRSHEVKKEVYYNGEPIERYHNKEYSNADSSKDLLYTTGSLRNREPSPVRQLQEVYHYETKTSSSKKNVEPVPQRSVSRNYHYESDVTDNTVPFTYDYNRSPSPARSIHNYSSSTVKESTTHRSPSPARTYYSTTSTVRNVTPQPITRNLYSSKTVTETNRRETQRSPSTPPPHRSPSPISFAQPPDPPLDTTVKTYNFERNVRPQSPPLKQKFSPSDPSRDAIPGHTMITRNYKYSSQSTQRSKYPADDYRPEPSTPSYGRPFPTPSPPPEVREQRPPKHIDELMASFSDTESHHREVFNRYNVNRSSSNRCPTPAPEKLQTKKQPSPPSTPTEKAETQKLCEFRKEKTNGVAGPPVYYPPGPLFTKKEETAVMHQCEANGKGKMQAKRKAKYEYKSGSKMREESDMKKTMVPICCPVCCALPCAIM